LPDFTPNNNGGGGKSGPPAKRPVDLINEPRCHVCQHPNRRAIDRLLAVGTRYTEISRLFSTEGKALDRRSISNHATQHLNYEDAAIRQIIEAEAAEAKENLEEGVRGAFARRVALDIALKKGIDGIIDGETQVEPRDLIKLIELRERLDQQTATAQVDELWVQFNAFKQAVQDITTPDSRQQIMIRMREILEWGDKEPPALQAPDS
jgi:hypothetical protein